MRMAIQTALVLLLSLNAIASVLGPKDSRVELHQLPEDWKARAAATLVFADFRKVITVRSEHFAFSGNRSLKEEPDYRPPVSPRFRFSSQPSYGNCTGFLVDLDLMVTAAHCLPADGDVAKLNRIILVAGLGYESLQQETTAKLRIPISANNIVKIKEVLHWGNPKQDVQTATDDFAIVRLSRPLFHLTPLLLESNFEASEDYPVSILGYPYGLPLKGDLEGRVAESTRAAEPIFKAFLDTGGGNSGGPVFNNQTQKVVGILVGAGGRDFAGCDPDLSGFPTAQCETHRPESVKEIEAHPQADRKTIREFWAKYPSGRITAWAARVLKIDAIAKKLSELKQD